MRSKAHRIPLITSQKWFLPQNKLGRTKSSSHDALNPTPKTWQPFPYSCSRSSQEASCIYAPPPTGNVPPELTVPQQATQVVLLHPTLMSKWLKTFAFLLLSPLLPKPCKWPEVMSAGWLIAGCVLSCSAEVSWGESGGWHDVQHETPLLLSSQLVRWTSHKPRKISFQCMHSGLHGLVGKQLLSRTDSEDGEKAFCGPPLPKAKCLTAY